MRAGQLRKQLLISVGLGLAVVAGLLLYIELSGSLSETGDVLRDFRWEFIPYILLLTLFNYILRFVKWEYYLRLTEVRGVRFWDSLLIFLSGLGMSITPAKVGEWIKSYFLKVRYDADPAKTAPIVIAERVSDGVAMVVLAAIGLIFVDYGWLPLVGLGAATVVAVAGLRNKRLANGLVALTGRIPVLKRHAPFVATFFGSSQLLFSPRPLAIAATIGIVSWSGEAVALYYVFWGLGAEPGWELIFQSLFILSISTMAGAVLLLPGGLGAAETGITSLGQALVGLGSAAAAAATLVIRLCTLWFGVGLGFIALAIIARRKEWWAEEDKATKTAA